MATIPIYFEGSWSILSTIGLVNVLLGLTVVGITGYSPIALVPIIVSIAGAIANGLCFYAFYENHSTTATLIAAIFADLGWLVQEAGLSFYSYMILTRVLQKRARLIFLSLFWLIMVLIIGFRLSILGCRAQNTVNGNDKLQTLVAHLHVGYFVFIAVIEIVSAFFLLRIFALARKQSEVVGRGGLFRYLTQSTELRLAALALIGITRAITYSFQKNVQSASDVAGQIDRFVFTLECMFPMIMYIDILASRIAGSTYSHPSASHVQTGSHKLYQTSRADKDIKLYSINHTKTNAVASGQMSSSQEKIVDGPGEEDIRAKSVAGMMKYDGEEGSDGNKKGTICKTVEFEFHDSCEANVAGSTRSE